MDTALMLSGVLGLGIAAQWLAWYLKQPSILFLLLIGILVGPILGYLTLRGVRRFAVPVYFFWRCDYFV